MSRINFAIFSHSLVSDWNHGNAHFLRGLAHSLHRMGHKVRCFEELGSWSLTNLVRTEGERAITAIDQFRHTYPELDIRFYRNDDDFRAFADRELRNVDVVIIHEWNDPAMVNDILSLKRSLGFTALFHDTHHRAYSSPRDLLKLHLHLFDGVLAFGEAIRKIYTEGFGVPRAWTFHEAADTDVFTPQNAAIDSDVSWIGNWGDEERTQELKEFLIEPARQSPRHSVVAYGVRYPQTAVDALASAGIDFRGYLPNLEAPRVYAESALSLHVPRRQYANGLSGIPTIRMFEALACGATLVSSPWTDVEGLFKPGENFVVVQNGRELKNTVRELLHDDAARRQIGASGRKVVLERHTCAHRAAQLVEICQEMAA